MSGFSSMSGAVDFGLLTSASSIETALDTGQFTVEYQPIVELATEFVIGAEALLRWRHPHFGQLAPVSFIPAAEASGTIVSLGRFVLDTAIAAAREWPLSAAGIRPFLTVNVSGRELAEPDYAQYLIDACARVRLDAGDLRLEVIESFFDVTAAAVEANLLALRTHGVVIVVDDFGSGFSDRLRITSIGASVIKIDRSLTQMIRGIGDPVDTAVLAAILAEAAQRSIEVIAEGVETLGQVEWYTAHGCGAAQGFFFSSAISADKVAKLIEGEVHWRG